MPVATDPEAGSLWGRVMRRAAGAPRQPDRPLGAGGRHLGRAEARGAPLAGVRLSILRRGGRAGRGRSPDAPQLAAMAVERSERYDTVTLPGFDTWALVLIRDGAE